MDKLFKQLEDFKKKSNHNISRGMIPLYAFGTVVAQIKNQLCLVVCANRGLHREGATGGPPSENEVTRRRKETEVRENLYTRNKKYMQMKRRS